MKTPKHFFRLALALLLFLTAGARAQTPPGKSLAFNGSNQYVSVPNFGTIVPTTELTVEVWVFANAIAGQTAFAMNFGFPQNRFGASISYPGGLDYWDIGNINNGGRLPFPQNPVGHWTHYAFVSSQSPYYLAVYTNGVQLAVTSGAPPFVRGSYDLSVGSAGVNGMDFNGSLTEFRVWNTARSQAQIQANFTNTLVGNEAGLVLYYKFDATNGTVATNFATATGSTYNGTLINNPAWSSPSFTVTNLADSGPGTLRQAALLALAGSVITFAPNLSGQTILLTSGPITLAQNLTITAAALPGGVQINGGGFIISGNPTIVLNALTLKNAAGSAVVNAGTLTVTNCTIASSVNYNSSGGIYNTGVLTVNNCTFDSNVGGSGGGIYNSGTLTVNKSLFSNNRANIGGGVFNIGTMTVQNCTFAGNFASVGGAGIENQDTLVVNNSTFYDNEAGSQGACINNAADVGTTNVNAVSTMTIQNSTISLNQGVACVGGINSGSGLTYLMNSIVCGNTGYGSEGSENLDGTVNIVMANNLVDTNAMLAPPGNHGGPTPTMPPLAGSPAFDAGDDASAASLAFDQIGNPRRAFAHVDIGAVEVQIVTRPATAVTTTAAIMNGEANTNGVATSYYFAYGLTTNYAGFTPTNLFTVPSVNAAITGLHPDTTYHFQLVVNGPAGTASGGDLTFATFIVPGVSNLAAQLTGTDSGNGSSAVRLSATVNPYPLQNATVYFHYGLTSAYGGTNGPISVPASSTASNLMITVGGFAPGKTYHWNVVATNAAGAAVSPDQTFGIPSSSFSGIAGDLDGDGVVSFAELNAVYANYATNAPWLLITNLAGLGGTNVTFMISNGVPNTYSVQYATNLASPNWVYLAPAIPFYGFTDSNAPAGPKRFYRLRYP